MTGGRIVLDAFRSANDPMLSSWLSMRTQLLGETSLPAQDADARVLAQSLYGVWRVLATNNRELGRGAALHSSPLEARHAAETGKRVANELTVAIVRGAAPMSHAWILRHEGSAVLTASRWYESASEARAAARTARAALAAAIVIEGVNVGTNSGRRQRRPLSPLPVIDG